MDKITVLQIPDACGVALKDMLDRLMGSDISVEDACLAAIAAAINAWPGMKSEPESVDDHNAIHWPAAIILPLQ